MSHHIFFQSGKTSNAEKDNPTWQAPLPNSINHLKCELSRQEMVLEACDSQPPELFLCPISYQIMQDPVVLVETGQMYDRASITHWFEIGHNTCPLTGRL